MEEKFKQISSAYEVLSDPEQKWMYDATLQTSYQSDGFGWNTYYDSDYDDA